MSPEDDEGRPGRSVRDWRVWVDDIVEACDRIRAYTADLPDATALAADSLRRDAVLFNVQIIGEAVKRVPPGVLARAPEIEWRRIAGMRDRIAHADFALDEDVLWVVIRDHLGPLRDAAERLRAKLPIDES